MNDELIIYTKRIKDEGYPVFCSIKASDIELDVDDVNFFSDINIDMKAFIVTHELFIRGNIKTECETFCDRCNENTKYSIDIKDVYFCYEYTEQDFIDISDDVRSEIILYLPTKKICKETCKGMCVNCKVNLNIDECKCEKTNFNNPFKDL